jgi:hypothetical protein
MLTDALEDTPLKVLKFSPIPVIEQDAKALRSLWVVYETSGLVIFASKTIQLDIIGNWARLLIIQ